MYENSRTRENTLKERREFLKEAGKVAVTVPAVALLLSMHTKPAHAQVQSGHADDPWLPS